MCIGEARFEFDCTSGRSDRGIIIQLYLGRAAILPSHGGQRTCPSGISRREARISRDGRLKLRYRLTFLRFVAGVRIKVLAPQIVVEATTFDVPPTVAPRPRNSVASSAAIAPAISR